MINNLLLNLSGYNNLNQEEKEIVDLLLLGKTNAEISLSLGLKEKTIEKRLSNIYITLGVEQRANNKRLELFVKILNIFKELYK